MWRPDFAYLRSVGKLLELQRSLETKKGNTKHFPGGPLVWLIVRHVDLWRVYAVRLEDCPRGAQYESVDQGYEILTDPAKRLSCLWENRVTSLEGALQILLIMDFINEWAREVYRKSILEQLRRLIQPTLVTRVIYRPRSSQCFSTPDPRTSYFKGWEEVLGRLTLEEPEMTAEVTKVDKAVTEIRGIPNAYQICRLPQVRVRLV